VETLLAFRWYLVLQLFGLAALPLTLRLLRHLPGRGYAFARPLGLVVGGWAFWLMLTLTPGWLPNSALTMLAALALLATAGAALWLRQPTDQLKSLLPKWQHVLAVELLLAAAFVGWCLVRTHMPRIETAGGEKWMEIAFLNATLRSPTFPPNDPWLSGFSISYYYFGYVIMSMVMRLSAVPSTIGFNLGIATLFALTCTGAYGLVYGLLAAEKRRGALWGGLLGPVLVAITGNLEGLLEALHARGLFSASFWQWLDIRSINVPPPSFATGSWIPTRFFWWWRASRVLHDYAPWHTSVNPAELEVIDEFPAFSFLLGDMHPHLLGLPFVLLALALALALCLRKHETWKLKLWKLELNLPLFAWEFLPYALCLGGLGFLNTWDFPIYLFVVIASFVALSLIREPRFKILELILFVLFTAIGGFILYLPFWLGLSSQVSGILPNAFNATRLPQFLVMFAPLLFPVAVLVVEEARRRHVRWWDAADWTLTVILIMAVIFLASVLIAPQGRQYLAALRGSGAVPGLENVPNARQVIVERLQERLRSSWTALLLAALIATTLATFSQMLPKTPDEQQPEIASPKPQTNPVKPYLLVLVVTGALLTMAVEFVYLKDHFSTRMNTVFKFYFQAWVLWGIAGAYGLARLLRQKHWWVAAIGLLLVVFGLVYLALAIPTRAREYGGPPTLDGAAHLRQHHAADFTALDWLNENVDGAPIILETPGDRFRAYIYEGRVSAFTGLPTLLGWGGHQHQWRGTYEEPGKREPDIEILYTTTDPEETLTLLDRYGITYVYIGPVEQSRYPEAGLAKFAGLLDVVYNAEGATIYRYTP
jgi:YYY domain-containing protein